VCGNGVVETGESCDDGAKNGLFHGDGTGCSSTCTKEPTCRDDKGVTTACVTRCGDGNVDTAQGEECDDSNGVSGDGCSASCKLEGGFTCTPKEKKDAQACKAGTGDCLQLPITYRDFDGSQSATGHPDFLYMGSTPKGGSKIYCVPNASGREQGKQGDDNSCPSNDSTELCLGLTTNTLDANGKPVANTARPGGLTCACQFTDWDKTPVTAELVTLAEKSNPLPTGITVTTTCHSGDKQKVPVVKQANAPVIQSADTFKQWYSDSDYSTATVGVLELSAVAGSTNLYRFTASNGRTLYDDLHDIWLDKNNKPAVSTDPATKLSSGFFPLEDATGDHATKVCNIWPYWTAPATCVKDQWDSRGGDKGTGAPVASTQGVKRNFYFTTEARYLFRYAGGETLTFHGDDDVWVYVNGKLVLDMGATHERLEGTVKLSDSGADAVIRSQDVITEAFTQVGKAQTTTGLGLEKGRTYEIAIFHADHHPRDSNYQLTLTGFSRTYSECAPTCGDGVATVGEECDNGAANQDDVYGGCTTKCLYGPFCGDGVTNGTEQCDLGRNNKGGYGADGCTPSCQRAHFCGDGILDSAYGEACDAGASSSGSCDAKCQIIMQ
jgi:fibro-slime domain-containing protein